jgi:AcrR family transcriptional regulator
MNHISNDFISKTSPPVTRRALAKARTRENLMTAAKGLFTERGYEEATVRDIASAAGMSTGAVFANFTDKADLFRKVLARDARVVAETMKAVSDLRDRGVRETLLTALAAAYAFHIKQLPLFQAACAEGWRHGAADEAKARQRKAPAMAVVEDILRRGMRNAELRADMDIDLAVDLIWQVYESNYKLAVYDQFDLAALTSRLEQQLDLILPALAAKRAA